MFALPVANGTIGVQIVERKDIAEPPEILFDNLVYEPLIKILAFARRVHREHKVAQSVDAVLVDDGSRRHDIAKRLGHLLALGIEYVT